MGTGDTRRVWYTAYGSNLRAARLTCYLSGGSAEGARRAQPGCRDRRPPSRAVPAALPGGIYFSLESKTWTGGMAFYDPYLPGTVAARGYLLGVDQFLDIAAQEMHRPPGTAAGLVEEAVARGRAVLGPGRYETVIYAGDRDGYPMLTFTAPWRAGHVRWNPPSPGYLAVIAAGLRESRGWDADQVAEYLVTRPGVAGSWSRSELRAVAERVINAVSGPTGMVSGTGG